MADLILVRHGQASFGAAVYDKLSPMGEKQSALLGDWLSRCAIVPDVIASGSMIRQVDTAKLCATKTGGPSQSDWLTLDGLGEYDHETVVARFRPDYADSKTMHAAFEKTGNPRRAFHAMYVQAIARWTEGRHDDYFESWSAFKARVLGALRRLAASEARTILAFTSGGPITAIVQHLLHIPDANAFDANWPLVNAGMTRLRFSAETGSISLATYNAYPHFEEAGDPALVTFR